MAKKLSFDKLPEVMPEIAKILCNQVHSNALGGSVDFRASKYRDGVKMNI